MAAISIAFASSVIFLSAQAQTIQPSQVFISWSALGSYAPANYAGKLLPNQLSQIAASVEVITNGKLANLSNQTIYWYQNDNLMGGGVGAQHFVFRPYGGAPNTIALKVEIPNYPGGLVIHELDIPITQPRAVIAAPYPKGVVTASPANLTAIPYFFSASSTAPLSFSWIVNGQAVSDSENPSSLQISIPGSTPNGYDLSVALTIKNSTNPLSANSSMDLTYQK